MAEQLMDVVTPRCPICRAVSVLKVDNLGYRAWRTGGALIQNALPDLNADQREMLQTGIHPACWDKMVAEAAKEEEGRDNAE